MNKLKAKAMTDEQYLGFLEKSAALEAEHEDGGSFTRPLIEYKLARWIVETVYKADLTKMKPGEIATLGVETISLSLSQEEDAEKN